jgi:hypothetical protein
MCRLLRLFVLLSALLCPSERSEESLLRPFVPLKVTEVTQGDKAVRPFAEFILSAAKGSS